MAGEMSNALRLELKRLKGELYQINTQYEEELPAYLRAELEEVSGTIEQLATFGHLDIRKG